MFKTEQEEFWSGDFGNQYIERNKMEGGGGQLALFSKIFSRTNLKVESVIEFGANIGLNVKAIRQLLPNSRCAAVEINHNAVTELKAFMEEKDVFEGSILDYHSISDNEKYDFVFTKGVLIHINPEELDNVYRILYETSKKYICIIEYYNPMPVSINYRGYDHKLFKRDFAGEILDKYRDLTLEDYGFVYHRDNNFPQDDLTWFLLKKNS